MLKLFSQLRLCANLIDSCSRRCEINIANFVLGRSEPGADAVCLVAVDGTLSAAIKDKVKALPDVVSAYSLTFAA